MSSLVSNTEPRTPSSGSIEDKAALGSLKSSNLSTYASPQDAFDRLWRDTLSRFQQSSGVAPQRWRDLFERMSSCKDVDEICEVFDHVMKESGRLHHTNTTWQKLRSKYLKPATQTLLLFVDVIAETASHFPVVPGGKAIFVAVGVLLEATKGVTSYCEALVAFFEKLNIFLDGLRIRIAEPRSFGPASTTVAIAILSHLIDTIVCATVILSKRPWLQRLTIFGKALMKDNDMQKALQRLHELSALELQALAVETRLGVLHTHASVTENLNMTSRLLSTMGVTNRRNIETSVLQDQEVYDVSSGALGMSRDEHNGNSTTEDSKTHRSSSPLSFSNHKHQADIHAKLCPVQQANIDAQSPEGCMGGTRVQILDDLKVWAHDPDAPRIFWLNGMAGTGKSAIARSLCHTLRRDLLLGGSFFCSRGQHIDDAQRIIPTLAACLAGHDTRFSKALSAHLLEEPFATNSNFEHQIRHLFSHNVKEMVDDSAMATLVIDALDECSDEYAVRDLLSNLVQVSSKLPLKFFLTSRPEPHIRRQLQALTPSLGHILRLHDIEQDLVTSDISLYLSHGLRAMRESSFPPTWPPDHDIATLANRSGKLFIYANTALRYVCEDPVPRLARLTSEIVTAGRPMHKPLDDIYNLVLSDAMDTDKFEGDEIVLVREIVSVVIGMAEPLSVIALAELLETSPVHLRSSLNRLYAVIYVPLDDHIGTLSVFHASFADFATTPSRIDQSLLVHRVQGHEILAEKCLNLLESTKLHFNISGAATSFLSNTKQDLAPISDAMQYACLFWQYHLLRLTHTSESWTRIEHIFLSIKFIFWLEVLSILGKTKHARDVFGILMDPNYVTPQMLHFLSNAVTFLNTFQLPIAESVPHLYLSALPHYHSMPLMNQIKCLSFFQGLYRTDRVAIHVINEKVSSAAYLATGDDVECLLIKTGDGIIHSYDVRLGVPTLCPLPSSHRDLRWEHVASDPDGICCISAIEDECIRVWDITNKHSILPLMSTQSNGPRAQVCCIALSLQGGHIALGMDDSTVTLWSTASGHVKQQFKGHHDPIISIKFSENGSQVVSLSQPLLLVWDVESGTRLYRQSMKGEHAVLTLSMDGTSVISGSTSGVTRVWDIASSRCIKTFRPHDDIRRLWRTPAVHSLAMSSDGKRIASAHNGHTICIWDVESESLAMHPFETSRAIKTIALSSDGTRLVSVCGSDIIVEVWNVNGSLIGDFGQCCPDATGWFRGSGGNNLIWVPPEDTWRYTVSQHKLMRIGYECDHKSYRALPRIDWTGIAVGDQWSKCYIPSSAAE